MQTYLPSIRGKEKKMDLANDRGIFIISVIRSIFMKMLYNDNYETLDSSMSDSNVGARRGKNIRNHIFVINGVINEAINNKHKKSIDILIYDYKQCFDSMWLEEALNDLYEAGVKDDNLALIHLANETNKVAVKTPHGLTERKVVDKIVLQGGVFGPIKCSVQVDTIGKECLENEKHLYKYKDTVGIPPLGMVDDLLAVAECGVDSVLLNGYINAKTNIKKLQFGAKKCHKIHIGNNVTKCPELFIDEWKEKESEELETIEDTCEDVAKIEATKEEKYLGDLICENGKNLRNIENRKCKGLGNIKQIMSILDGICYGKYQFEVAVIYRNSLLLSSLLANSEAWYNVSNRDLEELEAVDENLLRKILETPISTPKEMLYLELGCSPIRFIIKQRRILFLQYILKQEESSLIFKVLEAQYNNPAKNDWITTVLDDMEELELEVPLQQVAEMSKESFKNMVKNATDKRALEYLNCKKLKHKKVKHINHDKLELQEYLKSKNVYSIQEAKFLMSLRSRMLDVKANYENKYYDTSCVACKSPEENQEHLLQCAELCENNQIVGTLPVYTDIFGTEVEKMLTVARLIQKSFNRRKQFVKK